MKRRSITTVIAAAASALLVTAAFGTPANADTPESWESQALGLHAAQKTAKGDGVTVAVLDSGVVENHPALAGKVTTGPDYVNDGRQQGDSDWGAHGTAMASDVLKVAPAAHILSVRVIDDDKENTGELVDGPNPVAQGVDYAVKNGADVISMSLGSDGFVKQFQDSTVQALLRATAQGVTVVASAGNTGEMFNGGSFPAAYPSVVAVAAVGQDGTRADFSTIRTYNAVAAPGVRIASAKNTGGYEPVSGTSPAAALTSGIAALMLSENDKLSPAQVRTILNKTAHHPSGGWNAMVGHGMVNAAASVQLASDPPPDRTDPVAYKGKEHLVKPNAVSPTTHPPLNETAMTVGIAVGGVGILMVVGAVIVVMVGRRRSAIAPGVVGGPYAAAPGGFPPQPR